MSEEDHSRETDGPKGKYDELQERVVQEGARLHDRISEALGTPKGGTPEDVEEDSAEEGDEDKAKEGEEDKAKEGEE